jgi:hypothetical protein
MINTRLQIAKAWPLTCLESWKGTDSEAATLRQE